MKRPTILIAIILLMTSSILRADTFTNKKTGQTIKGSVIMNLTESPYSDVRGPEAWLIRLDNNSSRILYKDQWKRQEAEPIEKPDARPTAPAAAKPSPPGARKPGATTPAAATAKTEERLNALNEKLLSLAETSLGPMGKMDAMLVAIYAVGPDAIPLLTASLTAPQPAVRVAAAVALGDFRAKSATPQLLQSLLDPDVDWAAPLALSQLGPEVIPKLVEVIKTHHVLGARRARMAIEGFGAPLPEEAARIPELVRLLKDPSSDARLSGIRALIRLGPMAEPALPNILQALDDKYIGSLAMTAIAGIAPTSPEVIKAVTLRANQGYIESREVAIKTLGVIAAKEPSLLPTLATIADNPNARIAAAAIESIGFGKSADAIPLLLKILKSERQYVYFIAGNTLQRFGPDAAPAIPELTALLESPSANMRSQAVKILGAIGPAAVPTLGKAIKNPNRDVRLGALEALAAMGPQAAAALPAVKAALNDPDADIKRKATIANESLTADPKKPPRKKLSDYGVKPGE